MIYDLIYVNMSIVEQLINSEFQCIIRLKTSKYNNDLVELLSENISLVRAYLYYKRHNYKTASIRYI